MNSKYFIFSKRNLAITTWLPNYKRNYLKSDIIAGLTVGIMLIPQGIAYAQIAGMPLVYGLYASVVPAIIYVIFGSSLQLSVGPTAVLSLLVASSIGQLAEAGSQVYIELTILLALIIGLIQLGLSLMRLGFLVNYLSHPVISGFTSAAAVMIGVSQFKHLLGVDLGNSKLIHQTVGQIVQQFGAINWIAFAIGVGAIVLIVVLKRFLKHIPGSLIAILLGILITYVLRLDQLYEVKIVGTVPRGFPSFEMPTLHLTYLPKLLPMAVTIALISFMESIAIAKAVQMKDKSYKVYPNQELGAIGLMNVVGAFFQSFPTTGSFSRTAVNVQNGAKTGIALLVTAIFIGLTLLFLTDVFFYLPIPILAAIIIVSVIGLIDIKEPRKLWFADRKDFWVLMTTFLGTMTLGIEKGILAGVFLSMVIVIYETTLPNFAVLGKIPDEPYYKDVERFANLKVRPDTLIMRFEARLYFANIAFFKKTVSQEINRKGKDLKAFFFDASAINTMDSSAFHALEEVIDDCQRAGIDFYLIGIKGRVRDEMKRSGLMKKIGRKRIFIEMHHAVCEYNNYPYKDFSRYVTQSEAKFIDFDDDES